MSGTAFLQQVFYGLSLASIYALVASGITVTYGLTRLVNFAHGEIVAIGAYTVLVVAPKGGGQFVLGLIAAIAVTAVVSLVLERGLFRWTIDDEIKGFLVSLGLIYIIENLFTAKWTINAQYVAPAVSHVWQAGGVRLSVERVIVIGAAAAVFGILWWVVNRTWYGMAARAAAMDREMLALTGVPVRRILTGAFVVGGALAGFAGAFFATLNDFDPTIGSQVIVQAFVVAIIGGLGNVGGAVAAAVIVGLLESMATLLGADQWVQAILFVVLIVVVMVRPQGLFKGTDVGAEGLAR